MEPWTSIMTAIFKVLQEIAKAEREARRNQTRCRDLAQRAQVVSYVLRDAKTTAVAETGRMILCRLKEALDDALKLVESCGQRNSSRRSRLSSWFSARLDSRTRAARFDDVDKRINHCLIELCAANGSFIEKKIDLLAVSARDHHPDTNKPKEIKVGNAPQECTTEQGGKNRAIKRRRQKKAAKETKVGSAPQECAPGQGGKNRGRKRRRQKKKAAVARSPPPDIRSCDGLPTVHLWQKETKAGNEKCAIGQGRKNRGSKQRKANKKVATAVVVAR